MAITRPGSGALPACVSVTNGSTTHAMRRPRPVPMTRLTATRITSSDSHPAELARLQAERAEDGELRQLLPCGDRGRDGEADAGERGRRGDSERQRAEDPERDRIGLERRRAPGVEIASMLS